MLRIQAGVGGIGTVVQQVLLTVGPEHIGVPGRERGLHVLVPGQGGAGCLISRPAARTWEAVGGAVDPYIRISGRPSVDPMSPILADEAGAAAIADPEAMPAGPSGPAQPGVITAAAAADSEAKAPKS